MKNIKAVYIKSMLLLTPFTLKLIVRGKTIRTLLYTKTVVEVVAAHLNNPLSIAALETHRTVGTFCVVRREREREFHVYTTIYTH